MLSLLSSILGFCFAHSKTGAHNRTYASPIENICLSMAKDVQHDNINNFTLLGGLGFFYLTAFEMQGSIDPQTAFK